MTSREHAQSSNAPRLMRLREIRQGILVTYFAVIFLVPLATGALRSQNANPAVRLGILSALILCVIALCIEAIWVSRSERKILDSCTLADILETVEHLKLIRAPRILLDPKRWDHQLRSLSGATLTQAIRMVDCQVWRSISQVRASRQPRVRKVVDLLQTIRSELQALEEPDYSREDVQELLGKIELHLPHWEKAVRG